jgi:hypothetical protein
MILIVMLRRRSVAVLGVLDALRLLGPPALRLDLKLSGAVLFRRPTRLTHHLVVHRRDRFTATRPAPPTSRILVHRLDADGAGASTWW